MKVLFTTNIPSPYRVEFFEELGKLCELTVIYERESATNRNEKWLIKEVENFNQVFLKGFKCGADSALSFSIIKFLNDKSFDIVILGGYSTPTGILSALYLAIKGRQYILNCDGGIIKKRESNIKKNIKRFLIGKATWWTSTSEKTSEYLLYYGARIEDIYWYPFTSLRKAEMLNISSTTGEKEAIRAKLKIPEKKVIVAVGQFIYRKGFDVLLNACKEIDKETGVYIIGSKANDEYINIKKCLQLKNVNFISFKSKEELADYYKAADLFVLPTREDIWGLVINEAMSHGLPVITTDNCLAGLELVIDSENGYIVPVEDVDSLANKINSIFKDDVLRLRMSSKSLEIIQEYSIENMASRYIDIFSAILNIK